MNHMGAAVWYAAPGARSGLSHARQGTVYVPTSGESVRTWFSVFLRVFLFYYLACTLFVPMRYFDPAVGPIPFGTLLPLCGAEINGSSPPQEEPPGAHRAT